MEEGETFLEGLAKASLNRHRRPKREFFIEPLKYETPRGAIYYVLYNNPEKIFSYEELREQVKKLMKIGSNEPFQEEYFQKILEDCVADGRILKIPTGYQAKPKS
jgi:hypothetical protein